MLAAPFRELLEDGTAIRVAILDLLSAWPKDEEGNAYNLSEASEAHRQAVADLVIRTRQWFNSTNQIVSPLILHDRSFLYFTLRQVEAAIRKHQYRRADVDQPQQFTTYGPGPQQESALVSRPGDTEVETRVEIAEREANEAMEIAFDLIKSVPSPKHLAPAGFDFTSPVASASSFQPNTGFILMWLDRTRPELEDVSNAIKSACRAFGIRAFRADNVEHQEKITDVVLGYIRNSEFLIADLTGERPNVYYEIGYAHAIGKRPILFRREGCHLHFDLSEHNVPEYRNVTELSTLLRRRLEAMTGRKAMQEQ